MSDDDKKFIAAQINEFKVPLRKIARRYNISQTTAAKYAKNVREGIPLHNSGGAPPLVDPIASKVLVKKLSGNKRIQLDAIELVSDYSNAIKASSQRKNATPRQISKKSLKQDLTRWKRKTLFELLKLRKPLLLEKLRAKISEI